MTPKRGGARKGAGCKPRTIKRIMDNLQKYAK